MPLVKKRSFSPDELDQIEGGGAAPQKRSYSPDEFDQLDPSGARAGAFDLLNKFNQAGYKTATPGFFRDVLNGATAGIDTASLGNLSYNPTWRREAEQARAESPTASTIGAGGAYAALGGAQALLPEAPILLGGLQGALTRPGGSEELNSEDLARRTGNAAFGAGGAGALKLLGAGLGRAGDWAMQKAVGMKEFIPGMGTRMANEGIIGTKGMMQNQIPGKLAAREAQIQAALPQVQGQISAVPSSSAIDRIGAEYVPGNPDIAIPSANQPFVDAAHQRSLEAVARGSLSPADALDVARTIDRAAYDTASPMGRFQRSLGKADSGALRAAVKEAANAQGVPQVTKGLASEQALINARDALQQPEPMGMDLLRHHIYRGVPGMIAGESLGHGLPGMIAGGLATVALASPLGMSTIGQGLTKGSQVLPYTQPAFMDEMIRRAMEGTD